MRNFALEAIASYLGMIGTAAVCAGVIGLSATFMEVRADVAAHDAPVSTAVAWHIR